MSLYLIDTDLAENSPEDRALSARLYGGDQETRLCQEILLGIGGVRVLRAMGIDPSVWHSNEGHSAFLTLERLREKLAVSVGQSFRFDLQTAWHLKICPLIICSHIRFLKSLKS